MTTENDYVTKIKNLMDELRIAREKIKDLENKQKKDEKTVKSQFDHMIKLQEKCRELKATATGGDGKGGLPIELDKEKQIDELKDKLLQAEKNKEIMQSARDSEINKNRMMRSRYEAQLKELNAKIEKLEVELREKTQESKIASTKIRELQSSGNGLPIKRENINLKPLKDEKTDRSGRLPSVGRTGTTERNRPMANTKT